MGNRQIIKTVFWIIGPSCSGKSYYGKLLSNYLKIPCVHLDIAYKESPDINKEQTPDYKSILNIENDVFIIEGIWGFIHEYDMSIIKSYLNTDRIIYVLINPNYDVYCENVNKRKNISQSTTLLDEKTYKQEVDNFKFKIGEHIEITNENDIYEKITLEDIRSIRYQKIDYTKMKWDKLKINVKNKSVLDLGCNSCYYEIFAKNEFAVKYTGLDVNKAYLFNKNAHLFDLNHLEDWNEKHDIVISTSMLHYIKDKENFIKESARITKETFVLETPLSEQDGLTIECDPNRNYLFFPSKKLLELWIGKYFKSYKCLGKSVTEDNSYRLIYHCKV